MPGVAVIACTEQEGIAVYPNPTPGRIVISGPQESGTLQLKVMDATGKLILSQTVNTQNYEAGFDLQLEPGIYLVDISDRNNNKLHKKLIINK